MKFDVIVGNPPYQEQGEGRERGQNNNSIWPEFVEKSFDLCKNGGYVCLIHPSGWRNLNRTLKDIQILLRSKDIKYLEMHNSFDGVETFGVQTSYDWYVAHNIATTSKTTLRGQDGKIIEMDISKMPFIPNGMIEEIVSLFAKDDEEKCNLLYDASGYHHTKKWMQKEENIAHKYPCVYTTEKSGKINCWYSSTRDNGHFGVPKVFWSNGSASSVHVDTNGKYALTQFAYAIVDSPDNLENIKKAMESKRFVELMKQCDLGNRHLYNYKVIALFRKDFWKAFINE
jgi:type I restriction-modification system DNA methylase subunit